MSNQPAAKKARTDSSSAIDPGAPKSVPPRRQSSPDPKALWRPRNHWESVAAIPTDVVRVIAKCLEQRYDDGYIPFARSTAGGWEGWLQVELAKHLKEQFNPAGSGAYQVVREQVIWKDSGKTVESDKGICDIVLTPNNKPVKGVVGYTIELKVSNEADLVRDNFIRDIEKIRGGYTDAARRSFDKLGCGFKDLCIAVSSTDDDLKQVSQWSVPQQGPERVNYIRLREHVGDKAGLLMFWYMSGDTSAPIQANM